MRTILCTLGAAGLLMSSTASADVLHFNGSMVTHPAAGPGGADVSMASPAPHNTAGSNVRQSGLNPEFRMADDFTIGSVDWLINNIVTYGYETNAGTPTWTGGNLKIWSGSEPGQGTPVFERSYTAAELNLTFSGVNRVFNGAGNLTNTARRVHAIHFDTTTGGSPLQLGAGQYWVDWQVEGGNSGWGPYVMLPDPTGGTNTITVFGNGRQLASTGWQPTLDAPGAEMPFTVEGTLVPEPASALALLGLGGLALRRRKA